MPRVVQPCPGVYATGWSQDHAEVRTRRLCCMMNLIDLGKSCGGTWRNSMMHTDDNPLLLSADDRWVMGNMKHVLCNAIWNGIQNSTSSWTVKLTWTWHVMRNAAINMILTIIEDVITRIVIRLTKTAKPNKHDHHHHQQPQDVCCYTLMCCNDKEQVAFPLPSSQDSFVF